MDRNTEEVRSAQRDAEYSYRIAVDPGPAKEVRLFGLADWTLDRFIARRTRLHALQYEATRLREKPVAWSLLVVGAANIIVFVALANATSRGAFTLGEAVVFAFNAVGVSMIAFGGMSWALDGASSPVAAVLRLEPAMAAAGALTGPRSATTGRAAGIAALDAKSPARSPAREIRFRDVTFAYPDGASVLEHFDLTIPAGSSLAIVGQNGAGKTTIAKLLCRLYDPQAGAIEIDGVDLRDLPVDAWRQRITAVFQDFTRFELPLRDNVAPGGAPDDTIRQALAAAGADQLATLDTILARGYDGGTDLSGGQWQRVALARALNAVALGAGLVLLDEPTAQLDVRGEAEIFERILKATRHCTTILISHRFSTVRQADRICVLEHGRVLELGTHDELMARGGRYRTMFELQAQRFVTGRRGRSHLRCPRLTTSSRLARTRTARQQRRRSTSMPPALSSMWRLCKLGYRHEPRLMLTAFILSQLAALPDALIALWLMLFGQGVIEQRPALVQTAAIGIGVSAAATWFLGIVSVRMQRRFRDRVTIALESHVARLQASIATIAHHERPEFLDRLSMLRNQVFVLDHMYMSLFSTLSWMLRLGITVALLVSIHPALILVAVLALPHPVVVHVAARRRARRARTRGAADAARASPVHDRDHGAARQGSARHRHRRAPDDAAARGVRTRLRARRRRALGHRDVARARLGHLRPRLRRRHHLRRVVSRRASRRCAAGGGGRLAALVLHRRHRRRTRIPARFLDGRIAPSRVARRLRGVARRHGGHGGARAVAAWHPPRSRVVHLSRHVAPRARQRDRHPATRRGDRHRRRKRRGQDDAGEAAGEDVRAARPATIHVDDTPLARMPAAEWRARMAGAFQDFFRFEFRAHQTVGLGDVPRIDDRRAVSARSIARARTM